MARLRVRFRAVSGSSVLRLLEHYAGCLDAADFDWFFAKRHRELLRYEVGTFPIGPKFSRTGLFGIVLYFSQNHVAYMKSPVFNLGIIIASCGLLIVLYPDQSLISTFVDKVKVISQHFFVQLDVRWTLHPAKTWNGSFSWDDGL
ncbi:unnamed protein product [Microthlaspi erraticum]|uniref:Uncharacterized protein n=1 Tax=Microthlaspi erraticum TaxID=1685480 RepID=A0A6D2K4H0_9BRAS|nr:unnamed protein product [Microthlaspi erraticum]